MKIRTFPFSALRFTALLGAVMFFVGCAKQEQTALDVDQLTPAASQRIVDKAIERARLEAIASTVPTDLVTDQFTDMDPVSEAVDQMANQLISGLTLNRVKRFPIAVLPFASLRNSVPDDLFGERISENFIFPMQQRGYNLVDYRAVSLATTFKSPVSRQNMSALRNQYKIYFVLTGTYAKYEDGVVMNARILDTTTRQVLASAQTHIPNRRLEGRLPGYDPVRALRNGYIIENGSGPIGME
jgi:TolB-like protein